MHMDPKKFLGFILAEAMICTPFSISNADDLQALHSQNTTAEARIAMVFDTLPASWDLSVDPDNKVDLTLTGVSGVSADSLINTNKGLLSAVSMEKKNDVLTVHMETKTEAAHYLHVLHNPEQLVLDLFTRYEGKTVTDISPGISYTYWTRAVQEGRQRIHILHVAAAVPCRIVMSDNPRGISVNSFLSASHASAAVNGKAGEPPMMKAYGKWENLSFKVQGYLAYQSGKGYTAGIMEPGSAAAADGKPLPVSGVDRVRRQDELILYTPSYGSSSKTNDYGAEAVISGGKIQKIVSKGNTPIGSGEYILSGHGKMQKFVESLKPGQEIKIVPARGVSANEDLIYGGEDCILQNGRILPDPTREDRAPRTILGVTANGDLIIAEIEGWQMESIGMSRYEAAEFIQSLGASNAVLISDAGAGELAAGGKILNQRPKGLEPKAFTTALVFFSGS